MTEFMITYSSLTFRSRRGSQENILENDGSKTSLNNGGLGPIPDIVMEGDTRQDLSYWLRISVSPLQLEREVGTHPGVAEVLIRGVHVPGVGLIPRAYVTLKDGFTISAEELATWCNTRLEWQHRYLVLPSRNGIYIEISYGGKKGLPHLML